MHTVRGEIRVPTVIEAVNYAKVPKKRPKLCSRTIREQDSNRFQYTGRVLRPDEGSLDHVVPRSRGGEDASTACRLEECWPPRIPSSHTRSAWTSPAA